MILTLISTAFFSFIAAWIVVPILLGVVRFLGFYLIVRERQATVFVLFGKVVGCIDEPGFHFLPSYFGLQTPLIAFFGKSYTVDLRLDQYYLRSQPVNSEEGTPMGIGVWYEMAVANPVDYLFKNTDPRGSLQANVSNTIVRSLSNMPLDKLLEDRHGMSRLVRQEVSPKSEAWGYHLGSVYIRKVHFRDENMIHQIEQKVVNRLRQVTSAIRQVGVNQVAIIKSDAERSAAAEFARAAATRPYVVGTALQQIAEDREILDSMFEILETQKMLEGEVELTLIPSAGQADLLAQLLAAQTPTPKSSAAPADTFAPPVTPPLPPGA